MTIIIKTPDHDRDSLVEAFQKLPNVDRGQSSWVVEPIQAGFRFTLIRHG